MYTGTSVRRPGWLLVVAYLISLSGCGTNLNDLLYQTASAGGRTFLDLLLTDTANAVADSFDQGRTSDQGSTSDQQDAGGGTAPQEGPPLDELTGDPDAGGALFSANNCTACHCPDARGGCALDAPSLPGVATEMLDGRLRGDIPHPGGKFDFANQDIVDLQAFLASLVGDG